MLQLVRQSVAESLHTYLSTNQLVTDLVTYLKRLGIQGVGLVEATERSPIIGHVIGTSCGPPLSQAILASPIPGWFSPGSSQIALPSAGWLALSDSQYMKPDM